ncbi:MAG: glycosyl transferase [marine bacterium B5-7]|nr:MAG: glycosyl transferase [marine bacterium B5-7]
MTVEFSAFTLLMSIYSGTESTEFDRCLKSIVSQSRLPKLCVIVLDGPVSDAAISVLDSFENDLRINRVVLEDNKGLGHALDRGLKECQTDLVARMDSDDICCPDRFEKQLRFLSNNPEVMVLGGAQKETIVNSNREANIRQLPLQHEDIKKFAKYRNPMNHPTVMFRRRAVLEVGGYEPFDLLEDYYLWMRMIIHGHKLANLPDVMVESHVNYKFYRRRGGMRYVKSELRLAKQFRKMGAHSLIETTIFLLTRLPLRLISGRWRAMAYTHVLRGYSAV